MGEVGLGREALATICEILKMPSPVSDSAYQKHNKSRNLATNDVLEDKLSEGRRRLRKCLENEDETEILDVALSFDGTWSIYCQLWSGDCYFCRHRRGVRLCRHV